MSTCSVLEPSCFFSTCRLKKVSDYMVRARSWTTLISLLCLAMQGALKSSPALVVRSSRHLGSASSCYAAMKPGTPLVPHVIHRRPVGAADVAIDIKFAGICHSCDSHPPWWSFPAHSLRSCHPWLHPQNPSRK